MDRTSKIFNNKIDKKTIKKANKSKLSYLKKYGNDLDTNYLLSTNPIDSLKFINTSNIVFSDSNNIDFNNALIVGNIRMGFGHYRISIAMASCAKALGYTPLWLDLASFNCTGSKMIQKQNNMYSFASRISQKSKLFNHFVWEPLNRDGFRQITYNAIDQKNSENLVPIFRNIPKDIPYIATHVWPSQAAVHADLTHVVNAIPDNWPMALHLSEGAIHTVQTPFAYLGYKMLNGFAKKPLNGMPSKDLKMVGNYIDHELLVNLEADNKRRIERIDNAKPLRILITVGGAGAGSELFLDMINHLIPLVKEKKVSLFINYGDHLDMYQLFCKKIKDFDKYKCFFNEYNKLLDYNSKLIDYEQAEIINIYNKDIFEAVYSTNLLMPNSDLLITKPSELAYYPIPKLFMRHIGGHEVYGAIHGSEFGDSTFECPDSKSLNEMIDRLLSDKEILKEMITRINKLKEEGYYNGGYECVRLAVKGYNE